MRCVRILHRRQAAKAALVRQGVKPRVLIGRSCVPGNMVQDLRVTKCRRGVLIRAIDRFDAKHPRIAMCIALLIAFMCFYVASEPGKSETAVVHMHVASPAT
jgi:hypothetical protein